MARFNETIYDAASKTATVGSGLKWDAVYNALANYSVNVVGGRIQGVGVAGFTLGGGKHLQSVAVIPFVNAPSRLLLADEPVWTFGGQRGFI